MRHTFEGPANNQNSSTSPPEAINHPTPAIDGHLEPPVLTKRPNMKSRSSTAKPKSTSEPNGKGKGKATKWDSDDDDDDDAYVTSNDFAETPERRGSAVNGRFSEFGKDDDDELYH